MSEESHIKTSGDGKRFDVSPRFRRGHLFKTKAGSVLALEKIVPDLGHPDYVDKVIFTVKKLAPADITGPQAFFFLEMRYKGGLNVGDKVEIINADLGAIKWPRVKPMYHGASDQVADLNPQLGWPGGPCHVVERIHNEVRNPRLRDNLTDKVEDGSKLTNPEANKIYSIETDRGTKIKFLSKFRITPHAQYRMDQRGITVNDLRVALKSFGKAFYDSKSRNGYEYQSWSEDMAYGKEIVWTDKDNGRLVVVFQADGRGNVVIITTYWENLPDPRPSGQCRIGEKDMKRISALPLMSPLYNMREVCKQIVLLEDHLNQTEKRCPDCISKHFITIEALIEEGLSLDKDGKYRDKLEGRASRIRSLQSGWASGNDPAQIAQELRALRKEWLPGCFDIQKVGGSILMVADRFLGTKAHFCERAAEEMVTLVAQVVGQDLLSVSDDVSRSYKAEKWPGHGMAPFDLYLLRRVPMSLAEQLMDQTTRGSIKPFRSDREAWKAAQKFAPRKPSLSYQP